jgi:hypothetical protein
MVHNKEFWRLKIELQNAWQGVLAAMRQMHPSSQIRPPNATDIFSPDSYAVESKVGVGPIVLNVPERANYREANLYIVISGWISFGDPLDGDQKRTTLHFGTRVGYFRLKDGQLVHVYGVHYDMDEELAGHPVFHAQMCSQADFGSAITDKFKIPFDAGNDRAIGLLRNVRTPTAQMDLFSVITQIAADHLMSDGSAPEVHAGFRALRESCDFFIGAAGRIARLNSLPATRCYRSTHWYNRKDSDVA